MWLLLANRLFNITKIFFHQENVTGISFRVDSSDKEEVLKYLNFREAGGYRLEEMLFHPQDCSLKPFNVFVYMATKENPNYLGPAPEQEIAKQIIASEGRSGSNLEYFHELVQSLEQIGPSHVDNHLMSIKSHTEDKSNWIHNEFK